MLFYDDSEESQRNLMISYSVISAYFYQDKIIIVRTTEEGNNLLNKYETRFRHYTINLGLYTPEELIKCLSNTGFDNGRDPENKR